jgi:hypothetical protein
MISLPFTQNMATKSHLSQVFVFAFLVHFSLGALPQSSIAKQHKEGRGLQLIWVEVKCEGLIELGTRRAVLESCFLPLHGPTCAPVQLDDTHIRIWKTAPRKNLMVASCFVN